MGEHGRRDTSVGVIKPHKTKNLNLVHIHISTSAQQHISTSAYQLPKRKKERHMRAASASSRLINQGYLLKEEFLEK
jgi:hypothetical protein